MVDMDVVALHERISKSVVTITITVDNGKIVRQDAIVIELNLDSAFVIADSHFFAAAIDGNEIDTGDEVVTVILPGDHYVYLKRDDFHFGKSIVGGNGIVGITVNFPNDYADSPNAGDLLAIPFCEEELEDFQQVYTYSEHHFSKLLTPGRIMLIEDKSFDHDCSSHNNTPTGAPVINKAGQLVGLCYQHFGYLSSYNTRAIIERIYANLEAVEI